MRDDFSQQTLDVLAKRVGVRCSNPACRKLTTGPRSDTSRVVCIGVGAHITAASEGGPRFDPSLTPEQRRSAENGIWLCQNCAKLVDNDPTRYPVDVLRQWKRIAEEATLAEVESGGGSADPSRNAAELEISNEDVRTESRRHDYRLVVTLRNLGNGALDKYHVDLEMPAQVIETPVDITFYLPDRSTPRIAFFRSTSDMAPDKIYPGDSREIMSVSYYMDDAILRNLHGLFQEPVRATLYRPGFQPVIVERPFKGFQHF